MGTAQRVRQGWGRRHGDFWWFVGGGFIRRFCDGLCGWGGTEGGGGKERGKKWEGG